MSKREREREREVIFRDKFVSGSRCCNDFVALNIFLFPYRLSLSVTNSLSLDNTGVLTHTDNSLFHSNVSTHGAF